MDVKKIRLFLGIELRYTNILIILMNRKKKMNRIFLKYDLNLILIEIDGEVI